MKQTMMKFLTFFVLILLAGCATSLKEIDASEIFTQEGSYYVYFYRDGCSDCERAKPFVKEYSSQTEKNAKARKIYLVNLSKKENKIIYRAYANENGQGEDGTFFVDDVTNHQDLYIGATSALIRIGSSGNKKIASFIASGATDIELALNEELERQRDFFS